MSISGHQPKFKVEGIPLPEFVEQIGDGRILTARPSSNDLPRGQPAKLALDLLQGIPIQSMLLTRKPEFDRRVIHDGVGRTASLRLLFLPDDEVYALKVDVLAMQSNFASVEAQRDRFFCGLDPSCVARCAGRESWHGSGMLPLHRLLRDPASLRDLHTPAAESNMIESISERLKSYVIPTILLRLVKAQEAYDPNRYRTLEARVRLSEDSKNKPERGTRASDQPGGPARLFSGGLDRLGLPENQTRDIDSWIGWAQRDDAARSALVSRILGETPEAKAGQMLISAHRFWHGLGLLQSRPRPDLAWALALALDRVDASNGARRADLARRLWRVLLSDMGDMNVEAALADAEDSNARPGSWIDNPDDFARFCLAEMPSHQDTRLIALLEWLWAGHRRMAGRAVSHYIGERDKVMALKPWDQACSDSFAIDHIFSKAVCKAAGIPDWQFESPLNKWFLQKELNERKQTRSPSQFFAEIRRQLGCDSITWMALLDGHSLSQVRDDLALGMSYLLSERGEIVWNRLRPLRTPESSLRANVIEALRRQHRDLASR